MHAVSSPRLYDYSLTPAQEERALRLHRESIIIDMLFQGPVGAAAYTVEMVRQLQDEYEKHRNAWRAMLTAMAMPPRMAARGEFPMFREWWEISGITCGNRQLDMTSFPEAVASLAVATLQFDRLPWLVKALTGDDIRRAKAEGKHAGLVTAQNTVAIGQDLDNLDMFYECGLRVLQLSYNMMNFVGSGCTERTDAGISNFGARFIERMNKLGMVVDTGHCGNRTTLDACEISCMPVIASHTCVEALSGHARGKSDEEIRALAKTGGVIGIVTVPTFLNMNGPATMNDLLDHVDYVARLVGPDQVGIGTDWPNSLPDWGARLLAEQVAPTIGFRPQDKVPTTEVVDGFADYREFINITRGLVSRGYSDEQVRAILGGNWLRVLDQVLK